LIETNSGDKATRIALRRKSKVWMLYNPWT